MRLGFLRKERIVFVESLFGPPNKFTNKQQNDNLYFILHFIKISYQTTSQSVKSYNTQITYFLNNCCLNLVDQISFLQKNAFFPHAFWNYLKVNLRDLTVANPLRAYPVVFLVQWQPP
jgi:hypothetical protein